jgi:hypothetical protein
MKFHPKNRREVVCCETVMRNDIYILYNAVNDTGCYSGVTLT